MYWPWVCLHVSVSHSRCHSSSSLRARSYSQLSQLVMLHIRFCTLASNIRNNIVHGCACIWCIAIIIMSAWTDTYKYTTRNAISQRKGCVKPIDIDSWELSRYESSCWVVAVLVLTNERLWAECCVHLTTGKMQMTRPGNEQPDPHGAHRANRTRHASHVAQTHLPSVCLMRPPVSSSACNKQCVVCNFVHSSILSCTTIRRLNCMRSIVHHSMDN